MIDKYLGIRGEGFDCWALVREVYANEFGVDLPAAPCDDVSNPFKLTRAFKEHVGPISSGLNACEPEDFAIALMSKAGRICHVGIYYRRGILHYQQGCGACWQPLTQIHSHQIEKYYKLL